MNDITEHEALLKRITDVEAIVIRVEATLDAILTKIDEIQAEVKPTIDQLTNSSLFRLTFGGRKR